MAHPALKDAIVSMERAVEHLRDTLTKINVGRATTALVDDLLVEAYGAMTPVKGLASVSTPDASTLVIAPWDRSVLGAIEKAILASPLHLTPSNDGSVIRLNIPKPTEEKRRELSKLVREEAEQARISVRSARQDVHGQLKRQVQASEITEDDEHAIDKELQVAVDRVNARIEELATEKEKELLTI